MIEEGAKILYSLLALIVALAYARHYGPRNFLWLSDLALFGSALSWWLRCSLLTSMIAVGTLALELFWAFSLGLRLLCGRSPGGLVEYLFDPRRPRALRALSLFHLLLPAVLLRQLQLFGYDERALLLWLPVVIVVLLASRRFATPEENLNWSLGPGRVQRALSAPWYLALWLAVYLGLVVLPTHGALRALFPAPASAYSS